MVHQVDSSRLANKATACYNLALAHLRTDNMIGMLYELSKMELCMTPLLAPHKSLIESGFVFFLFKRNFLANLIVLEDILNVALIGPQWTENSSSSSGNSLRKTRVGFSEKLIKVELLRPADEDIDLLSPSTGRKRLIGREDSGSDINLIKSNKVKSKRQQIIASPDKAKITSDPKDRNKLAKDVRERLASLESNNGDLFDSNATRAKIRNMSSRSMARSVIDSTSGISPAHAKTHPLEIFVLHLCNVGRHRGQYVSSNISESLWGFGA